MDSKEQASDADQSSNPFLWLGILNVYAEKGIILDMNNETPKATVRSLKKEDISTLLQYLLQDAKHRDIAIKSLPVEEKKWKLNDIR